MNDVVVPFPVEPGANNHFAWVRTVMALQRTHLATVRTSAALIGFGFTVSEFLAKLRIGAQESDRLALHSLRNLGLFLIGAGVLSLAVFTSQYHRVIAYLGSASLEPISGVGKTAVTPLFRAMTRPVYLISYTVVLIGVAAFVAVLVRI
jgi:putative membrane protein